MLAYLPLILKNCWRNRRRTTLTIASIGVSMCLLGVMISLYHAFYLKDPAPNEALRLITRNRISLTVTIPASYRSRIMQVPGVRDAMAYNWFGGTYKDARDPKNFFARFAIDPDKMFNIFAEYKIPDDQKIAFQRDRTGCVIGRDLAKKFNFQTGDRINIVGDIYPGNYEFTVRGIYDSPQSSEVMFINSEYIEQTLPERRRGNVGTFAILIDDPSHSSSIAETIDAGFRNSPFETKTESEHAFTVGFLSLLGNVKMFLMWISAAVLFTILLVSANTMAMSVRERVREIGVLKTLGFTPGGVLSLILGAACAISLAGGLLGYAISAVLMQGIAHSPMGGFVPPFQPIEPAVASVCVLTAIFIGVMSSLVPALTASRIDIVQALRSTD
jgi:putative ABC transport system permease protein